MHMTGQHCEDSPVVITLIVTRHLQRLTVCVVWSTRSPGRTAVVGSWRCPAFHWGTSRRASWGGTRSFLPSPPSPLSPPSACSPGCRGWRPGWGGPASTAWRWLWPTSQHWQMSPPAQWACCDHHLACPLITPTGDTRSAAKGAGAAELKLYANCCLDYAELSSHRWSWKLVSCGSCYFYIWKLMLINWLV